MTKADRLEIKLRLIEQLVVNPNLETTSADMEYWEPLHEKLKNKLATCEALAMAVMMDQTSHDEREKTFEAKIRKECAELCRAEANGRSPLAFDALHECADLIMEGHEE